MRGLRDGKGACCTNRRAWVQTLSTHIKAGMTTHAGSPALHSEEARGSLELAGHTVPPKQGIPDSEKELASSNNVEIEGTCY